MHLLLVYKPQKCQFEASTAVVVSAQGYFFFKKKKHFDLQIWMKLVWLNESYFFCVI